MPPCHLLPMAMAGLPSTLSAPGVQERDRQTGRGLAPAPAPPGAPQGAAGDSSPSELISVSFLVRGAPGGESAAGGGEVGSATDLSPGRGGGGQGPGWHTGGGVNTLPCQPPHNHLILSEAPLREAVGVSCLHCPSEEGGQVFLRPSCPPSTLECFHISSSSVQWEQGAPVSQGGGEDPCRWAEGLQGAQNCAEPRALTANPWCRPPSSHFTDEETEARR